MYHFPHNCQMLLKEIFDALIQRSAFLLEFWIIHQDEDRIRGWGVFF